MKSLIAFSICLVSLTYSSLYAGDLSTRETVDSIISWGVGLSGSTSLLTCTTVSKDKPVPNSFYTFNLAAVGYFAMDQLINDEDEDASKEIAARDYGGSYDEQMNSYLRSRDVALANAKSAEKKGHYKLAASAVMLTSAALAYYEKNSYEKNYVLRSELTTKLACSSQSNPPGVLAAKQFQNKRCNNLGGAKVICSDNDKKKLAKLGDDCSKLALDLGKSTDQASCIANSKKVSSIMSKLEDGKDSFEVIDPANMTNSSEVENLKLGATTGRYSSISKSNFFITKFLTLEGAQYMPGSRAIVYSVLSLIVGANAYANNVAKLKFEEDAEYFQSLIDGTENCSESGGCHSGSGEGDTGDEGDEGDNHGIDGGETYGSVCYTGSNTTLNASEVVSWSEGDPASWNVSSSLEVNFHGSVVHYGYPGGLSWPNEHGVTGEDICKQSGGDRINSTVWFIVKREDGWHAKSWDWASPCSPSLGWVVKGMQGPPSSMRSCKFGFMMGGLYNSGVTERSEIVLKAWP